MTGLAAARYLRDEGASISFADDEVSSVEDFPIAKPETYDVAQWDFILISPGWKHSPPLVQSALTEKIPLLNEIDLAWSIKKSDQKWIALTGTNGKTTTARIIAKTLNCSNLKNIENNLIPCEECANCLSVKKQRLLPSRLR